ncbi:MAG: MBL fold metallo-hydrolase [Patescibacteria group bacterium]
MKLTFCGASHEVTGSCYLLETDGKKFLVDCGMFQGSNFNEGKNFDEFPFNPRDISAIFVTHAHLDHVGRIPKLVKEGFKGRIYLTKGTRELAKLVWEDALEIMNYEHRKYQQPILYGTEDVAAASAMCQGVDYRAPVTDSGVRAIFRDAGHIFGSSFIELTAEGKRIIFSGDIGNVDVPILKDTENYGAADVILCESTYGDRLHEDKQTRREIILAMIMEGVRKGGTIMVPSFSIERTQEFLYELHVLQSHDRALPQIPIFLDSPLAIDATKVFKKYPEYYDAEAAREVMLNEDFLHFPQLVTTYTRAESKTINTVRGPKMVIAGAGMMNGGRILHHAVRYLSDPNSTLIIVGYQAEGTLGRKLYEGADRVVIYGESIPVKCAVKAIGGLSAHGDQKKMLGWIGAGVKKPEKIYCVHGETHAATELAHRIRDNFGIDTYVPNYGETVEL